MGVKNPLSLRVRVKDHVHPSNPYERTMRILALDIGDRRIGVALSDPLGILATPAHHHRARHAQTPIPP